MSRVGDGRVIARQAAGHDEAGVRQWSEPVSLPAGYLAEHGDLGYVMTGHITQSATTWTGIALTCDNRPRQALYPAMTRGRERNDCYVYPANPECEPGLERSADPEVAPRPDAVCPGCRERGD
jgi:hypothetical protein